MTEDHSWLNPINKIIIQNAVITRSTHVKVKINDREISLTLSYDESKGRAKFKPTTPNSFTPCGAFEIRRVADPLWLEK
jgi:hypothetical protein